MESHNTRLGVCDMRQEASFRPLKWGVDVVIFVEQGANCLRMVQLMALHPKIPPSFASFKSRLVFPSWYRLTQVVLEKRPLNGCSSSGSTPVSRRRIFTDNGTVLLPCLCCLINTEVSACILFYTAPVVAINISNF